MHIIVILELNKMFDVLDIINQIEKIALKNIILDHWTFFYGDAHGIGYILDPRYLGVGR